MNSRSITSRILVVAAISGGLLMLAIPEVAAYCLIGVRWPDDNQPAPVYYNPNGKVTSGQCISSSQMDSAVTGGITPWRAISYAGTTTKTANKRDLQNTVGWANLGGQRWG